MRGRSGYRSSRESEGTVGNTSELSAMLNTGQKQKRAPLLRTTSLKLPNKNLYTLSENSHEEPALPNSNVHHHASKLMANRHRSSAASLLFQNLKNKRNSSNLSLKDMRNNSASSGTQSAHSTSQRPSLHLHVHDSKNEEADYFQRPSTNPINHYQFSRNMTTRPKSSSTTHIPTLASLKRTDSAASLNVELRPRKFDIGSADTSREADRSNAVDYKHSGKFFPQSKVDPTLNAVETDQSSMQEEDHDNKMLETQIETAINEELFPREYAFDNKFEDVIEFPKTVELEKARSITSSNQSPLTKVAGRKLSKTDSLTLENFQNDISNRSSTSSQCVSHTSRLQMKMDIMKSRFDSFVTGHDVSSGSDNCISILRGEPSSHDSENSLIFTLPVARNSTLELDHESINEAVAGDAQVQIYKFWFRTDLKTKLLTEKLANQLKNIERFPSSGLVGEKIVVSRIRDLATEQDLVAKGIMQKIQQRTENKAVTERPVLQMTSDSKDQEFEQLFENTKNYVATSSSRTEDAEMLNLRDKMSLGKTIFEDLWRDSEQSELLSLSTYDLSNSPEILPDAPTLKIASHKSSTSYSDDSMTFPVSPEDYRHLKSSVTEDPVISHC
ncbi:LANO_0B07448g1_1 [Lachancea nothofagi CBS 11611]|uniref:LANO_0B07448g1_1 n=1 Tax=Lachancea nothofagi CBS 11611 TaxID=1266666 RepID=A0A1G4IZP6_9SACH|nr:LANO_0B07448g1_1 [Lachancea nothofagi CBS 11611]